jgi:hypothetical protein
VWSGKVYLPDLQSGHFSKDLPATWMELVAADEEHNGNICPMCVIMIESGNSKFSKKEGGKYP